jgi:hypothetical protein
MNKYFFAWWNVENLFDVENSQTRSVQLKEILKDELKGWNDSILNSKLEQLITAISKMNYNKGPDLLGVCEVEDGPVLNKLVVKIKKK